MIKLLKIKNNSLYSRRVRCVFSLRRYKKWKYFCLGRKDKFALKSTRRKKKGAHGTNFECKQKVIEGLLKRNPEEFYTWSSWLRLN